MNYGNHLRNGRIENDIASIFRVPRLLKSKPFRYHISSIDVYWIDPKRIVTGEMVETLRTSDPFSERRRKINRRRRITFALRTAVKVAARGDFSTRQIAIRDLLSTYEWFSSACSTLPRAVYFPRRALPPHHFPVAPSPRSLSPVRSLISSFRSSVSPRTYPTPPYCVHPVTISQGTQ